MKTLGVMANSGKERAPQVLKKLAEKAEKLGLVLYADEATAHMLPQSSLRADNNPFDRVDAIMALGGDGTMLRVVRALGGRDKPVIGVNIGSLGFMTSVAEEDLDRAVECLSKDDFQISVRSVAECVVERNKREISRHRALNDVVVKTGLSPRVITLDVSINAEVVTSYVCDGLIVSTPTGSTGHSLSAGGPILSPDTAAFVVSLICPHTLSSRPLVVPDSHRISITVAESTESILLSVDGQVNQAIKNGDLIHVARSDRNVRFIHLPGYHYYGVLRQKLHWSGRNIQ